MRKGEVWRVRLPAATGHKQAGERPAVIIQNNTQLPFRQFWPFHSRANLPPSDFLARWLSNQMAPTD
jgi:hypothetical protein